MVKRFLNYFKAKSRFVFIVGTGRCGTTMLAQILNAHSKICIPHELQILFEYSNNGKRLYDYFEENEAQQWTADDFIKLIETRCPHAFEKFYNYRAFFERQQYPIVDFQKMIHALYSAIAVSYHKTIFMEQTPWYGQRLDVIKALFPHAKIIHMVRDGRDVAFSFARTPWWHDNPMENLERWNREINKISHDLKTLFQPRDYIEVKYEEFVSSPRENLKHICHFLNLNFEESMLNPSHLIDYDHYRKTSLSKTMVSEEFSQWCEEKREIVFSKSCYRWKKDQQIFKNISSLSQMTLMSYGYEVEL